jgi:hypothetical protein
MTWARLAPLDPKTKDYEHLEQVRLFALLSQVNHPAAKLTFAIPNQAVAKFRSKLARIWFWKEGIRAGVPDIFVPHPTHQHSGLFIEMKRPGEKPRKEQLEWHAALRAQGYKVAVCYSAQEAFQALLDYLGLDAVIS